MIIKLDMNDPSIILLTNILNNFFNDLEKILTKDILDENDIIKLVREKMHNNNKSKGRARNYVI